MIKKCIAVILIFACFLSLLAGQALAESTVKYGDINSDQKVDSADFSLLKRHVLGIINLTDAQFIAADVNADDKVDSRDMAYLKRKILGIIELLPAEQNQSTVSTASGVVIENYDTVNKTITFNSFVGGRLVYKYADGVDPANKRFDKVDITYKDGVILSLNDTTTIAVGYINKVNDSGDTTGTLSLNSLKSITFWFFGRPEYTSDGIYYTNKEAGLNKAVVKFNGDDLAENNVKQLIGKYVKVYLIGNSIYRIEAFDLNSVNDEYGGIITSINGSSIKYQKYDCNDIYLNGLDTASDLFYVFVDGVQKTVVDLKADMFFKAWQSGDGRKLVIVASTKKATGKLVSFESGNATVGATKYDTIGDNYNGGTKYISLNNGIDYNKDTLEDLSNVDVTAYIGIDNKIHFIKGTSISATYDFTGLLKRLMMEKHSITVVKDVDGVSTEVEYDVKTDSDDLKDGFISSTSATAPGVSITWSTFLADQGNIAGDKTGYTAADVEKRIYQFYVNNKNQVTKIVRKKFGNVGTAANVATSFQKFNKDTSAIEINSNTALMVDGTIFFDLKDNKVRYWKDIAGGNTNGVSIAWSLKDNGNLDAVAFLDDTYKNVTGTDLYYAYVSAEHFTDPYYYFTVPGASSDLKIHKDDIGTYEKQIDKQFIVYVKDGDAIKIKSIAQAVYDKALYGFYGQFTENQYTAGSTGHTTEIFPASPTAAKAYFIKKDGLSVQLSYTRGSTTVDKSCVIATDCRAVRINLMSDNSGVDTATLTDVTSISNGDRVFLVTVDGLVKAIYYLR